MTPDDIAKASEHSNQAALFAWSNACQRYGFQWSEDDFCYDHLTRQSLTWKYGKSYEVPELKWLHAVHNQGHGDAVHGAKAKAEGVKVGVSDIFLPVVIDSYAGLYIELKVGKNKIVKGSEQEAFLEYANAQGYRAVECNGWKDARLQIKQYLWPLSRNPKHAQFPTSNLN